MKRRPVLVLSAVIALLAGPAPAADFYFYVNATFGGVSTGACDAPFIRIADAIAAAEAQAVVPGDRRIIRIASGTYNERALSIDFSDVSVEGGYDPSQWIAPCDPAAAAVNRDPLTRVTVIDGQNNDRILDIECVRDVNGICATSNTNISFDGLVFRNGRPARTFDPVDASRLGGSGGAMLIVNSSVQVTNSTFENNTTREHFFGGGAIYMVGYYTNTFNDARLDLLGGNIFRNNSTGDGINGSGQGGAIFAVDANVSGVGIADRRTTVNVQAAGSLPANQFINNTSNGAGTIPVVPNCQAVCCLNTTDPNCFVPLPALTSTCVSACQDDGDGDNYGVCYRPNTDCNGDGTPESCTSTALGGALFLQNVGGTIDGARFEGNIARARSSVASGADFSALGGAIAMRASRTPNHANPAITNNTFVTNTAQAGTGTGGGCGWYNAWGGAIYGGGYGFDNEMRGNIFRNNRALGTGNNAPAVGWGGAVLLFPQNQPRIDANQFVDQPGGPNQAIGGGNGFSAWGGGLAILGGQPQVTNNVFRGNFAQTGQAGVPAPPASAYGGGMMGLGMLDAYPIVAGNTFEANQVRNLGLPPRDGGGNAALGLFGGGAMLEMSSVDGLIADNVFRANTATTLGGPFSFAGLVLQAEDFLSADPASVSEPRVQNNLIIDNQGIGLTICGDGGTSATPPFNAHVWSGTLLNNTIEGNVTGGIAMSRADDAVFDSNIIVGNDPSSVALEDILDEWIQAQGVSTGQEVRYNDIGVLPASPPDFVAAAQDGLTAIPPSDWVGVDPVFASGAPGLDHFLAQPGEDPGPPFSPLVDAVPVRAAARDFGGPRALQEYDLDGDTLKDTMANRTTRSQSRGPDLCFVDVGYHYLAGAPPTDTDGDGIPDSFEDSDGDTIWDVGSETNAADRDTDDDGVIDGEDCGADVDRDGTPAALDCDADGDGLTDGLELGITLADADTVSTPTCFSSTPCGDFTQETFNGDANPATRTDPLNPDSDGAGEWDGCEDTNHDGACNPCGQPCTGTEEQNPVNTLAGQADDDGDGDCMRVGFERNLGYDPSDADTDDDGISDGAELGFGVVIPPEAQSNPLCCDTDLDGLTDGLERSADPIPDNVDTAVPPRWVILGTDTTAPCSFQSVSCPGTTGLAFVDDQDDTTQTFTYCTTPGNCEGFDTDGDTCGDGAEDKNGNGLHEPALPIPDDETDPLCGPASVPPCGPDCIGAEHVRVNEEVQQLLDTSLATSTCGARTVPPMDQVMDAQGTCVQVVGCVTNFSITMQTRCTSSASVPQLAPEIGSDVTVPGAATPSIGCPLAFFEVDRCDYTLWVLKSGSDIILQAR